MANINTSHHMVNGTNSNDTITTTASNGVGQNHVYAKGGSDTINFNFNTINKFSHGHHARGDNDGVTNRGADTFNFQGLNNVNDVMVGRIEDFDMSRDQLSINGSNISTAQLQSGSGSNGGYNWRIVEYDADTRDSQADVQQWILIDTGQGYVFYALEGARATSGGGGASNSGGQESHYVGAGGGYKVTASDLAGLTTVGFVDPENFVPSGESAQGGNIINDDDDNFSNSLTQINGTGSGDLIAGGLNDDKIRSGNGNDKVWGGTGDDDVNAGNGNDTVYGGRGDDKLIGGNGHDSVYGGQHNDVVSGWGGNDNLFGGDGNDRLYGNQGNDDMFGGSGNDKLYASTGNDELHGGSGRDTINGGAGKDNVWGDSGDDTFEFKNGDLVDWDNLSGDVEQRSDKLDVIEDFQFGQDKIFFNNFNTVNSLSDLAAWKTTLNGDVHFTIKVKDTNERFLVDVDSNVTWGQMLNDNNFDFA
ncbi:MAG: calcium-binding protein [Alphaproteobacteria bacterium]